MALKGKTGKALSFPCQTLLCHTFPLCAGVRLFRSKGPVVHPSALQHHVLLSAFQAATCPTHARASSLTTQDICSLVGCERTGC